MSRFYSDMAMGVSGMASVELSRVLWGICDQPSWGRFVLFLVICLWLAILADRKSENVNERN
jgi:hypothetical protein